MKVVAPPPNPAQELQAASKRLLHLYGDQLWELPQWTKFVALQQLGMFICLSDPDDGEDGLPINAAVSAVEKRLGPFVPGFEIKFQSLEVAQYFAKSNFQALANQIHGMEG